VIIPEFLNNVFADHAIGYALLDADFRISIHNCNFIKYLSLRDSVREKLLFDIMPEAIGLEQVLPDLQNKVRQVFTLPQINRLFKNQQVKYFNIAFYATDLALTPVCIIINEITEATGLKQQLIQQKYEIALLESQNYSQGKSIPGYLLGNSDPIRKIRDMIQQVAQIPKATIFLNGESGTGKSLVARLIHSGNALSTRPFVEINCAAIPETLLEAELFGYEKGAFTNAFSSKPGLLEEADGGTLFLDEIGDLPLKLQVKLLSFIETRAFRRLGSIKELQVNIKLISASNRNIVDMIKKGEFREDLFYRLNVVNIDLPPLRETGEDIITIAQHFIKIFNIDFKKNVRLLSNNAKQKLLNYHWPGNVRELRNVIERAMIFAGGAEISSLDIHLYHLTPEATNTQIDKFLNIPPEGIAFEEIEKQLLNNALELSKGNQSKAARLLHMSRDAFRYRLEKYHVI
jgi:transcriptional regulator with PAS, ATPase and Fis domain